MWLPVRAFRMPKPTAAFVPSRPQAKSRDGQLEIVSVDLFTLQIRDVRTSRMIGTALRSDGRFNSAVFGPDGSRLLTTSTDGMAQLWDATTGLSLTPALAHGSPVICGAFSPDGRLVATGSSDNTSRVWNAMTGESQTPFMKHEGSVYRIAFTPDGRCLLTFSEEGSARVWDADTGEPITPLLDPEDWAKQAIESPGDPSVWNLAIEERPIDELRTAAEWLSGSRICETSGHLIPNTAGRFRELSKLVRARFPQLQIFPR
jgi:WD40 repeat protein